MPSARAYARKAPDERKRQLIKSTIAVLAEGGLAAFTVERIANHAGISKGLISHYFAGKDDLLAHAYEAMASDFDEIAEAYFEREDVEPMRALHAYIDASFDRPAFDRTRLRAWLAVWEATAGSRRLTEIHRQRQSTFITHLERLIAAASGETGNKVDALPVAMMLDAMITGLWIEWCLNDSPKPAHQPGKILKEFLASQIGG